MAKKRQVTIYGAGMSGLVAAINLARDGYEVSVHDREKEYGGDPLYNPSTHTTPIMTEKVSDYIGIDITPCFKPIIECPFFFHDTIIHLPLAGTYTVERGRRPTSLDSYLYPMALDLGVAFTFDSPLKKEDIPALAPGTIIACGLTPQVYDMLHVPYRTWYGWISRGEIGFDCTRSWAWWDEGITEYGYFSSANNYYFDLVFSIKPVKKETLERYKEFEKRHLGVEHHNWQYATGAVPVKDPANPRLVRDGHIYCGTISGFMDPMCWFGINGALISGKIAALAVSDLAKAQLEFARFSANFKRALFIKNYIWYPLIRPRVNMLEKMINLIGPGRLDDKLANLMRDDRHVPLFAIPGFANVGTCC